MTDDARAYPGKRKKLSQKKVNYRFAIHPKQSCASCVMFVPAQGDQPCHCTDVADPIYETGYCDIFAAAT